MARIVIIETNEKNDMRTVILRVIARIVPGCTEVLCRLITKIMMLVGNNEFDYQTEESKQNIQDRRHLEVTR